MSGGQKLALFIGGPLDMTMKVVESFPKSTTCQYVSNKIISSSMTGPRDAAVKVCTALYSMPNRPVCPADISPNYSPEVSRHDIGLYFYVGIQA